jgi:hypothetical protein
MPIGQETEVADALKPGWQHMDEDSAYELIHGKFHRAGLLFVTPDPS